MISKNLTSWAHLTVVDSYLTDANIWVNDKGITILVTKNIVGRPFVFANENFYTSTGGGVSQFFSNFFMTAENFPRGAFDHFENFSIFILTYFIIINIKILRKNQYEWEIRCDFKKEQPSRHCPSVGRENLGKHELNFLCLPKNFGGGALSRFFIDFFCFAVPKNLCGWGVCFWELA